MFIRTDLLDKNRKFFKLSSLILPPHSHNNDNDPLVFSNGPPKTKSMVEMMLPIGGRRFWEDSEGVKHCRYQTRIGRDIIDLMVVSQTL